MPDFSALLVPLYLAVLLLTLTPIPAIACFGRAFDRESTDQRTTSVRFFQMIPTCVCPILLLVLYAIESQPEWLDEGQNVWRYFTRGEAAWIYFPPYVMGNLLIARVMFNPDFAERTWLPLLSFVTCLLISLLFVFGYNTNPWTAIFPGSAAVAYACGLFRYCQLRGRLATNNWQNGLFVAWLGSSVATVWTSVLQARRMMSELPPDPPQACFVVTAAANGHRRYTGRYRDPRTGSLRNRQLDVFRDFEFCLRHRVPRTHAGLRRVYNRVGPALAGCLVTRWRADLMYTALKPLEWGLRLLGFGRVPNDATS